MPLDPNLDPMFDYAGRYYNVDPTHLKAIALAESSGNPGAESPAGAKGLMQLMPDTAKSLGVDNPDDPKQSILGGAQYYAQGLDKYNNPTQALMYYHGGPDESQWGSKTQAYPGAVGAAFSKLQQPSTGRPQVAAAPQAAVSGTDALAAVGKPSSAESPQQTAQAGGMSDDELWDSFVKGTLPPALLSQPARPAPQGGAAPQPANAQAPQSSAAPSQSLSSLSPAYIQAAADEAKRYIVAGRAPPPDLAAAATMFPGFPESPEGKLLAAQATATGNKQQSLTPTPGGGPPTVAPLPGSNESNAASAGAVAAAQQGEHIEISRDGGIYKGGVYIGHAPKMTDVVDAQGNKYPAFTPPIGRVAPGVAPPETPAGAPPGAVMSSPSEIGPGRHEALSKGEELSSDTYNDARKSFLGNQPAIQNLQNYLEAASKVGTGRGTNFSGNAAAWLKSSGVDPDKLSLADPAQVQIMQKAGNQMLAAAVRAISSRPAFADFGVLEKGLPDPEKQPEAQKQIAASLLGRMNWENQLFKDWDTDKRSTGSPSTFNMPAWVEAHPTQGFQSSAFEQMPNIPQRGVIGKTETPQFKEGDTATNPTTGEKRTLRSGQWVP